MPANPDNATRRSTPSGFFTASTPACSSIFGFRLLDQRVVGQQHLAGHRVEHVLGRGAAQGPFRPATDTTSPPSMTARTVRPRSVPQSSSTMMQSCATSTRRRVRYPELAVFNAVSASPLAGAVGGVEVFQNRQAFLEVGDDRLLDDLTRGLGHQSAQCRPTCASAPATHAHRSGSSSTPSWWGRLLLLADLLHHRAGDFVGATRPSVDHLVIALAGGDQTILVTAARTPSPRPGWSRSRRPLLSGMIRSSLPNEMPAFAAWANPRPISRSAKITHSFWPQ